MPRPPNYGQERKDRERIKAAKRAEKQAAKEAAREKSTEKSSLAAAPKTQTTESS